MKSQKEFMQALLDGKSLVRLGNKDKKVHLDDCGNIVDEHLSHVANSVAFYQRYEIYEEPKWEDCIPASGVLCWVGDSTESPTCPSAIAIIISYVHGLYVATPRRMWGFAIPLTKAELQNFLQYASDDQE